jgi:hypothetical protein
LLALVVLGVQQALVLLNKVLMVATLLYQLSPQLVVEVVVQVQLAQEKLVVLVEVLQETLLPLLEPQVKVTLVVQAVVTITEQAVAVLAL